MGVKWGCGLIRRGWVTVQTHGSPRTLHEKSLLRPFIKIIGMDIASTSVYSKKDMAGSHISLHPSPHSSSFSDLPLELRLAIWQRWQAFARRGHIERITKRLTDLLKPKGTTCLSADPASSCVIFGCIVSARFIAFLVPLFNPEGPCGTFTVTSSLGSVFCNSSVSGSLGESLSIRFDIGSPNPLLCWWTPPFDRTAGPFFFRVKIVS